MVDLPLGNYEQLLTLWIASVLVAMEHNAPTKEVAVSEANDVNALVMRNPAAQIDSWILNNYDQWQFWLTVISLGTYDGLGKTKIEAFEIAGYYKGRYELAKQFRSLVKEKTVSH